MILKKFFFLIDKDEDIYKKYIEELQKYNFFSSQPTISNENFLKKFEQQSVMLANYLASLRPIKRFVKASDIDNHVKKFLNCAFASEFQPFKTKADGNCLYHMISICLIGDTRFSYLLRALTVFTLLKYKTEFLNFISSEYSSELNQLKNKDLAFELKKIYHEIIVKAQCDKIFGNNFHIQAISMFLNKHIYIYNKFPNDLIKKKISIYELYRDYNNDNKILGRHVKYCPSNSSVFGYQEPYQTTIYGFYDPLEKHFTSLIPARINYFEFKPSFNWF